MNVFFSVGSPSNERQKQFRDAVREFLNREGLAPLTPGQNVALNMQPLKAVEHCMKKCSGVVVVAFERIHIAQGIERRGGTRPTRVDGENLPTVWNQVEGAMGYTRGLPLLVLAEHGLRADALLEDKYDWNVQWIDVEPAALATPEFRDVFADWKSKLVPLSVAPAAASAGALPPDSPADMSIGQLFKFLSRLKTGQAWTMATVVLALAFALWGAGFKAGQAKADPAATTAAADSTAVRP